jgi:hypothetical protein
VDDAERLTEFLHAAEVSVIAVAIDSDRHIKLNLVICVVRLALANVPRNTGSSQHNSGEGQVERLCCGYDADTLQSLDPNAVVCQHLLSLVESVTKLGCPLVDIVKEADRDVLVDTTGPNVGGVQTGARDSLVEFLSEDSY